MTDLLDFIRNNFFHVLPILIAGAVALVIIIERYRALYLVYPFRNENWFYEQISNLVLKNKEAEAISFCERYRRKPVARVIKQALLRAHMPDVMIENGLEIKISTERQRILKRTSNLAMLANVGTLLGLLGTIMGLVQAFKSLGGLDAQARSAALAEGISTAMNATMLGLSVAIPCMIVFNIYMNKTNELVASVEDAGVYGTDILKQQYFEAEKNAVGASSNVNTDVQQQRQQLEQQELQQQDTRRVAG